MTAKARRKGQLGFWQKLFSSSLAGYLVKEAKDFGIEQALFYKVEAGYLKGQKLMFDSVEARPIDFPICLELIDEKEKLDRFLDRYREHLDQCRVVIIDFEERRFAS